MGWLTIALGLMALPMTGCGGGATETPSEAPPPDTTGHEEARAEAEPLAGGPFAPMPSLNVYVQGPDPAPDERYQARVATEYRAEIVVTNTGDAPAELSFCMIAFQLVKDGSHVACDDESTTDAAPGPRMLGPGEVHTYEAGFHCVIAEPGRYELRAYMNFGAEIAEGEARERFYAGSRDIVVE